MSCSVDAAAYIADIQAGFGSVHAAGCSKRAGDGMDQDQRSSEDVVIAWANVVATVRSGELDRKTALERINCLICGSNDAEIRRFLKKVRRQIRQVRSRTQTDAIIPAKSLHNAV